MVLLLKPRVTIQEIEKAIRRTAKPLKKAAIAAARQVSEAVNEHKSASVRPFPPIPSKR